MNTTKYPVLKNPPLKEALLDIRVAWGNRLDLSRAGELPLPLLNVFTTRRELSTFGTEIILKGDTHSAEAKPSELAGFEFQSADDSFLMRMDKAGCSIHQLKNYTEWEAFLPLARSMWEHYASVCSTSELLRLGIRYVNQFRLELPFSLDDYFNFSLNSPADLPYAFVPQMLTQFTLNDEVHDQYGIVTFSLIKVSDQPDKVDVFFDIDIGKSDGLDADRIWADFDQMREMKNEVFFRAITQKTLEEINY